MPKSLAIFWDFDGLHNDLMIAANGRIQYARFAHHDQPRAVDVAAVTSFAESLGHVVCNRAFADWRRMTAYAESFDLTDVELIQIFTKNGLDDLTVTQRLARNLTDHLQDAGLQDTVLIIGGSSGLTHIAKLIKQGGYHLMGMGIREAADEFWVSTCDEFVYYDELDPEPFETHRSGGKSITEAHDVLIRSMNQLSNHYGEAWIQQVKIKPAMVRIDASFDEADYGYESFSVFLKEQPDIIRRRHRPGEQEPEFALLPKYADFKSNEEKGPNDHRQLVRKYLRVANEQGIRMPSPLMMWEGIDVYASFLQDEITFNSFTEIDEECLRLLREDFPDVSMTEVKKIRQVLFKCFLFRPSVDDTIGFHEDIKGIEDIEDRYFDLMLARIANNLDGDINYEALSLALTGNAEQAKRLEEMYTKGE